MVRPITMSLGRTAKVFSSTGNKVISETFKDNSNKLITITRVLNSNDDVLLTRMKQVYVTNLKNGKKIVTRKDESHVQAMLAGVNKPKQGKEFVDKFFKEREFLYSADNTPLFQKVLKYAKHHNNLYKSINIKKYLCIPNKISTITTYATPKAESTPVRFSKKYAGKDAEKLQYKSISYDNKGKPLQSNLFDLNEFEIFGN